MAILCLNPRYQKTMALIGVQNLRNNIPYSWKFSRDINFEDFDVSSKIKPLKFGFKIIIIGERACSSKFYSRKIRKRQSLKILCLENFQLYGSAIKSPGFTLIPSLIKYNRNSIV